MKLNVIQVFLIAVFAILVSSCIGMGKGSRKVKYNGYYLGGDGNNNDSTFFYVSFKNKSDYPLLSPNLGITVKDTSSKMIKPIIWSGNVDFADQAANSEFTVKVYAEDYTETDEVGKIKFLLDWTNKKGKTSFRRRIVYE